MVVSVGQRAIALCTKDTDEKDLRYLARLESTVLRREPTPHKSILCSNKRSRRNVVDKLADRRQTGPDRQARTILLLQVVPVALQFGSKSVRRSGLRSSNTASCARALDLHRPQWQKRSVSREPTEPCTTIANQTDVRFQA